jgi:hypothetical protein
MYRREKYWCRIKSKGGQSLLMYSMKKCKSAKTLFYADFAYVKEIKGAKKHKSEKVLLAIYKKERIKHEEKICS